MAEHHPHWTPSDWLRLFALGGAFGLFCVGTFLLYRGIAADGLVDIKSSLVSGTLKTGSAGLFICFFAFLVVVFTLLSAPKSSPAPTNSQPTVQNPRVQRLLAIFWGLLFAAIAAAVGAAVTQSSAFYGLMGFVAVSMPPVVMALVRE